MMIVSEMAKVTTVKQIPNTAPGRFLRPRKYEKNLDLICKHDNYIYVRFRLCEISIYFLFIVGKIASLLN